MVFDCGESCRWLRYSGNFCILLTKTTVAKNQVPLSYDRVRGLYFVAVIFAAIIIALYL